MKSSPERGGEPPPKAVVEGALPTHCVQPRAPSPSLRLVPLPVPGRIFLLALLLLSLSPPVHAQSRLPPAPLADEQLADPREEAAAAALMRSIRCLVCQGQSIADSNAELAGDMRALIRRRIAAGEQPEEVRDWLIARYGRWVSFDPPVDAVTWPLWALPILLLGAGLLLARGRFKRRRR